MKIRKMPPLLVAALALTCLAAAAVSLERKPGREPIDQEKPLDVGAFRIGQFIDPSKCKDCHPMIHDEWSGSVHSLAMKDPVFMEVSKDIYARAGSQSDLAEAAACTRCHAPAAYGTGLLENPGEPIEKASDASSNSIFCDFCHSVSGIKDTKNAGQILAPGRGQDSPGDKRGPRKGETSDYHGCLYSDLHTRSRFCGACHDVRHVSRGTPFQSTYTEWMESPYYTGDDATTVRCQDCHMRQRPGVPATGSTDRPDRPGKAATDSPSRPNVWVHYQGGANTFLSAMFGDGGVRARMAEELLTHCAGLKAWNEGDWVKGGSGTLKVKVSNDGAGHSLPTGSNELRRMWIEVEVKDAEGHSIYKSGFPDEGGYLPKDAIVYGVQFGDADGNPTIDQLKADRVLWDYRISPKGYRLESFAVPIPKKGPDDLTVVVRLKYRGLPQKLLDWLDKKAPKVPPVEMASASLKVRTIKP